jgi:putative salt-induced outer membrane protein
MKRLIWALTLCLLTTPIVFAQAAPAATKLYTGSFGGGFAVTGGNTDTKNFNLAFDMVRDPKTKNLIKAKAAYLRGSENKFTNLDRAAAGLRDEYTVTGKMFVFGQMDYLRDRFKGIVFIWSPSGGVGYKLVDSDATKFEVSGGAGGILEKDSGFESAKSGTLIAGESFRHKLSTTATFTESETTLWKTKDYGDSLTTFSAGVTTSIAKKLELQLQFVDSYKNKPASALLKKNDTGVVLTFLVKF